MHSFAAFALLTGVALLPGPTGPGPEIGKPAPAFTLIDAQGNPHSLADYKGKMVVIEWVNITCPLAYANYQSGNIPQLQKKYATKDVVWLSMIITRRQEDEFGSNLVSPELAKSMANDMVEKFGASPTAILIDLGGAVSIAYDTRTSMHTFVVDRKGELVYDGALDDADSASAGSGAHRNYVAAALDEAMAGKVVTTSKTMPYGCHQVRDPVDDDKFNDGVS